MCKNRDVRRNTPLVRTPRRSGTTRVKGGTRIISHDGSERVEAIDHQAVRATVRKGERRKFIDRGS